MSIPEVLVLGPGGARGYLYLGALCHLASKQLLSGVRTYAGLGVGSIFSLLLVCGYSPDDIVQDALESRFFHDLPQVLASVENPIRSHLVHRVRTKFGFVPNLYQLYMATGLKLVAVTTNITTGCTEYLSYENHPLLDCIQAVLMASHTPFLAGKLGYNGSYYADGMFSNPYPIDYFDNGSIPILGMYIRSFDPSNQVQPNDLDIATYTYRAISSPIEQLQMRIIKESSNKCRSIILYCDEKDPTGVSWSRETILELVNNGYTGSEQQYMF